mmetsp:Transcript_13164/g.11244  ORF Transcript_13164/g.11244 Transcript_13164/m.11244 type:complete len:136 (-) Transcript_13164:75-482(-)
MLRHGFKHGKGTLYGPKEQIIYKGEFNLGKIEGTGTYYYDSGQRYEGMMKDGLKHGIGILFNPDGSKYCEGNFKNGNIEGKVQLNYQDGSRYEGDVKNGIREGYGILYKKNGTTKKGIWKNDKFEFAGYSKDFEV